MGKSIIHDHNNLEMAEATERLVQLYDPWGKPNEAKKWRAERAGYPFVAPPREVKR